MQRLIFLIAIPLSAVMGQYGIAQVYQSQTIQPSAHYSQGIPVYSQQAGSTQLNSTQRTYGAAVYAQPRSNVRSYYLPAYGGVAINQSAVAAPNYAPPNTAIVVSNGSHSGLAQQKAQKMARMGMRGHPGGGLGGARYEGVGWSTFSSQSAIQQCCYWGQRTPMQIGVARGRDGWWYACVLYR